MMFATLEDLEGSIEVVVVPAVLAESRELLTADSMVLIRGRVDQKGEGETKVVAQEVTAFVPEEGGEEEKMLLRLDSSRVGPSDLPRLRSLISDHSRGDATVVIELATSDGLTRFRLPDPYRVDPRDGSLIASLRTLFGERCLPEPAGLTRR
jgi:DNA polymerase-3 subunit alpha